MPMAGIGRDHYRIPSPNLLHWLSFQLIAPNARHNIENLTNRVRMPVGPASRRERDTRRAKPGRLFRNEDLLMHNRADKSIGWGSLCRDVVGSDDTRLHAQFLSANLKDRCPAFFNTKHADKGPLLANSGLNAQGPHAALKASVRK